MEQTEHWSCSAVSKETGTASIGLRSSNRIPAADPQPRSTETDDLVLRSGNWRDKAPDSTDGSEQSCASLKSTRVRWDDRLDHNRCPRQLQLAFLRLHLDTCHHVRPQMRHLDPAAHAHVHDGHEDRRGRLLPVHGNRPVPRRLLLRTCCRALLPRWMLPRRNFRLLLFHPSRSFPKPQLRHGKRVPRRPLLLLRPRLVPDSRP